MVYVSDLGKGQRIYLENQDQQTVITLTSRASGQQQSQQSGFTTGEWVSPPTLFRTPTGVIIQIETAQGRSYIQVQASGMQTLSKTPSLENADVLPMTSEPENESFASMRPIEPMKPMKPMKMGDMEMQMNPMQMRMGDMEMRMGEFSAPATSTSSPEAPRRFCTQCGSSVAPEDKFCAHCGHQLRKG